MRCKQRLCAHLVVQVLDDAPRQAQPVERARAPANLIQDDQAAGRRVVQDVRRLAHLHHEGGLSARQIVACSDAREDAVHQVDPRLRRRDERASLRQQGEQRHLAYVSALARHVRPVMSAICVSPSSRASFGTNRSSLRFCSSTGCLPSRMNRRALVADLRAAISIQPRCLGK